MEAGEKPEVEKLMESNTEMAFDDEESENITSSMYEDNNFDIKEEEKNCERLK